MIKPGYRTSEFWFTLVSFIFSGLFLLGIIGDNDQKEELIRNISHGVESCILIGGQLIILYNYISSRNKIKKTLSETQHNDTDNTNKPRTNSSRTKSNNSTSKRKSSPRKKSSNK